MENSEKSQFQFRNYIIKKSLIEINNVPKKHSDINIKFNPKGIIDSKNNTFNLEFQTIMTSVDNSINIDVILSANFIFDSNISKDVLDALFYSNAPALIFPYVRAYISTLTSISGISTLTLQTLNMTSIGKVLKENTTTI